MSSNLLSSARRPSRLNHKFTALALAVVTLGPAALPSHATSTLLVTTMIGTQEVNARTFGAKGDGVHDDTAAIQAAINSLPNAGGTVHVTGGHYMINGLKPIMMRSHTRLWLTWNAELEVIPNSATRYYAIKANGVTDVRIVGGTLRGDRAKHRGNTGEWGFGVTVDGSKNVVIKDMKICDFWGDGIWLGSLGSASRPATFKPSTHIWVTHVTSDNNRRQGLSIGPVDTVWVTNSVFSNTYGTLPMAGIDIEPMGQGPTSNVTLSGNVMKGNQGNGLEIHADVTHLMVKNNQMMDNHGFGALSVAGGQFTFDHNTMTRNGLAGLGVNGSSNHVLASYNAMTFNSTRYISVNKLGGNLDRDLHVGANDHIVIDSSNTYSPRK